MTSSRVRLGIAVIACAVAAGTIGPASAAALKAPTLPVLGYQSEGDPTSLIAASAAAMDVVGVDGVNIGAAGNSVPAPDADARRQLAEAHALRKKAEFLVGTSATTWATSTSRGRTTSWAAGRTSPPWSGG